MRYKRGDLVGVQWEDSIGYADRWGEIEAFIADAVEKPDERIVTSAGIVLSHTDQHLMLAGSVHMGLAGEVHVIPATAIRRVHRLYGKRK